MSNNKTSFSGFRHEGHGKPLTRRQLLAQGWIGGSAMIAAPSLLGLLGTGASDIAMAAECGVQINNAKKVPFLCFDLSGGANIAGSNVLVGGPNGQMDFLSPEAYVKLGLPSGMHPMNQGQINTELGLAFHSDSAFLRGILSKTSAATRANINGAVVCAVSENDTGNNPHNPMYGIARAGAVGDLTTLIGTSNSESGGRSAAPMTMKDLSKRPVKIANERDARGLVDTGKLAQMLDAKGSKRVLDAIDRISAMKVKKATEDMVLRDLLQCAYTGSTQLVDRFGNPTLLDCTLDTQITGQATSIFQGNEINDGDFKKTAAVMKLVVNGFAAAGTVEMGGYDYHDGSRATGELRDFKAGQAMGAALEYAARQNRPLMLYIFSDGSVSSNGNLDNSQNGRGKGVWTNDSASTSAAFFLAYSPNGRPKLMSERSAQIGFYRPQGAVETTSSPAGNNVNLLAEAVVLNYMALNNELGKFSELFPQSGLGAGGNLEKLVGLQPIV
jgi:hypothetical protein